MLARQAEALRESELRYRRLFEFAKDGILILDAGSSKITHVNPFLTNLLDYPPEHFLGKELWQIGVLPDKQSSQEAMQELHEKGSIRYEDLPLQDRHGRKHSVEMVANVYREDHHRVIQCNIRDISERKLSEVALRQSEERYRALFDSAPMAVFVCDRSAVIQQYNARAVELWGREPVCGVEQHCGSTRLWLPDGALLPHEQSPLVDVLRTGVPAHNVEVFIERPDGSRLPVVVNFAPLKEARGEVIGAVTSFIDISERKRAEEESRQVEERLRFVMDSMPQKIFTATPNGAVDYFNPQWAEFTGLSFEEIRDWGWTQFIHPHDVDENVRVWQRSIDTGKPFQFEHRFRRADGDYRWHVSRALPMRDSAGQVVLWIGSNTDIHEQRQTANELRKLAAELSEADRRKDEFLAMLAHELRNPLAPIRNALQILRLEQSGEWRMVSGEW